MVRSILIDEDKIKERVRQLGDEITNDYKDQELTLICILKGSMYFFADLSRRINLYTKLEFMRLSSYEGENSTGKVTIKLDLDKSIEDHNVLVIEDIVDSGTTVAFLKKYLSSLNPKSLKFCTLLNKTARRTIDGIDIDYIGFQINDRFVIGYGLDLDEKYRNIPNVECFINTDDDLREDYKSIDKQLIKKR